MATIIIKEGRENIIFKCPNCKTIYSTDEYYKIPISMRHYSECPCCHTAVDENLFIKLKYNKKLKKSKTV